MRRRKRTPKSVMLPETTVALIFGGAFSPPDHLREPNYSCGIAESLSRQDPSFIRMTVLRLQAG